MYTRNLHSEKISLIYSRHPLAKQTHKPLKYTKAIQKRQELIYFYLDLKFYSGQTARLVSAIDNNRFTTYQVFCFVE